MFYFNDFEASLPLVCVPTCVERCPCGWPLSAPDLSAVAAQYVVPVNAVPTGGTLWARSLTTGAALTAAGGGTSIALDAPGWVDPDGSPGQPLAYAYSYLDPTLGVWPTPSRSGGHSLKIAGKVH